MDSVYLIIEMVIAAGFAITSLLLSEKFLQAGMRRWGWMLAGFILVLAGGAIETAFTVKSFAQLFLPAVTVYARGAAHALRLLGLLVVFVSFYSSVLVLYGKNQRERRKEDSLKLLDVIRETAGQSLSLIELVNFSIRELVKSSGSNCGCIFIYNPNREQLVLAAHRDLPRELERRLEKIENNGSAFFRTHKSGHAHVVGNLANADHATAVMLSGSGFKSLVVVPLAGRSGSFGVAALFSEEAYFYGTDLVQLISSAANILGPAIAALRMEREFRDALEDMKKAKKSQQFVSGLLDISGRSDKPDRVINSLVKYAAGFLGLRGVEIFSQAENRLTRIFPTTGDAAIQGQLGEHIRRSLADNKSLIVRTDSNGDSERMLIIPSVQQGKSRHVLILDLDPSRPELKPEELERIKAFARACELQLARMLVTTPAVTRTEVPEIALEELNDLNNILTGILGQAQFSGHNLQKESFPDQERISGIFEKIAEETYNAGVIIKGLQEKLKITPSTGKKRVTLDSALKALMIASHNEGEADFYLRDLPSIHFNFVSSQADTISLSDDKIRSGLKKLFVWIEGEWRPDRSLYVRLADSRGWSYFIVSENVIDESELNLAYYRYLPIHVFPDRSLGALIGEESRVEYYYGHIQGGSMIILRFPSHAGPKPIVEKPVVRPRILAIDDQEMIRELLSSMLSELKYPFKICPDGESGIRAIEDEEFDIIITDLGLPDIEGWEVARRARTIKPSIPVIVITGWGVRSEQVRDHENLADFILAKPFRMEQLEQLIKQAESLEPKRTK